MFWVFINVVSHSSPWIINLSGNVALFRVQHHWINIKYRAFIPLFLPVWREKESTIQPPPSSSFPSARSLVDFTFHFTPHTHTPSPAPPSPSRRLHPSLLTAPERGYNSPSPRINLYVRDKPALQEMFGCVWFLFQSPSENCAPTMPNPLTTVL